MLPTQVLLPATTECWYFHYHQVPQMEQNGSTDAPLTVVVGGEKSAKSDMKLR